MSGTGQMRQRRIRLEAPYPRIVEDREAAKEDRANDLLRRGFISVNVLQRLSAGGEKQARRIFYVLGRRKSDGHRRAAPEGNGHTPNNRATAAAVDPTVLNGLPWKYSSGGGEWAFYMDRYEYLLPELESIGDEIEKLKAGEEVTAGTAPTGSRTTSSSGSRNT